MSEEHPEFICPSCMWQGDEPNGVNENVLFGFCPTCGEEVQDREEYDRNEADNAREAELEERRLNYD